jgi:inosine-uridine nucleoside N-ribohydrolase
MNKFKPIPLLIIFFAIVFSSCNSKDRIPLIFDTDANNEIDDQHALAYLLFNQNSFDIKGITVNSTTNGGNINKQYDEAKRVMQLCGYYKKIPLLKGANGSFRNNENDLKNPDFDGHSAVNFIIDEALKYSPKKKLTLLAVGKLTNVALAVKKEPFILPNIRLVWLGSNYPESGEYNLENDIDSINFLLQTDIEFEIVTVRYGKLSGTDFVKVTREEVDAKMTRLGRKINSPVIGRHGGEFFTFGEYSKSLFDNTPFYGDPPTRSLFDMAAVAILKNPSWAQPSFISAPLILNNKWVNQQGKSRKVKIWENFNRDLILKDFYEVLTDGK